jgi:hypothetical protein
MGAYDDRKKAENDVNPDSLVPGLFCSLSRKNVLNIR